MRSIFNVRASIAITLTILILSSGCLSKETKEPLPTPTQQISASAEQALSSKTRSVLIKHCHDGDTCQVKTEGGLWFSIRLAGIDAPEIGHSKRKTANEDQPLALDSRDTLKKMLDTSEVITINQIDLDPFNRPVVEIFVGDTCVNLKMLEFGMAERYRGRSKLINPQIYDVAEQLAKANRVGIWGLKVYESPRNWRKKRKT